MLERTHTESCAQIACAVGLKRVVTCSKWLLGKPPYPKDTSNFRQEKSTRDAAAVKDLTVITLVYLPTTIVAVSDRQS